MRIVSVTALVVALGAADAHANAFDLYGCGSRGAAMGGALGATPAGPCSLYYNPAALTGSDTEMVFGLLYGLDELHIELDHNPTLGEAVRAAQAPSTGSDIPDTVGVLFGLMGNLGFEDLRVGAAVYLPANRVMRQLSWYSDEREYFLSNRVRFDLLGERAQHQVILAGGAYRLWDWLSLGAGVSLFISSTSAAKTYLPNPVQSQGYILMDVENEQAYTYSPNLGLYLPLTERLAFGLAWVGGNDFPISGTTKVKANTGELAALFGAERLGRFDQPLANLLFWSPHRLSASSRWDLTEATRLVAEVTWFLWSGYRDLHDNQEWRFDDRYIDPATGLCREEFCGCPTCDTPSERHDHLSGGTEGGQSVSGVNEMLHPADLSNTLVPRVGIEHQVSEWLRLEAGFAFEPTPVPEQVDRTNIVDNDRFTASAGAGFTLDVLDKELQVDWHFAYVRLLERHQTKDPEVCYEDSPLCDAVSGTYYASYAPDHPAYEPSLEPGGIQNPGYPGFSSGGHILVSSVTLGYRF